MQRIKSHLLCENVVPFATQQRKKLMGTSSILAWGKSAPFYCYKYPKIGVIPVGDRSAADLFVLVFEASRSGEVMIVSVPFAFQVRSLQGLVKLETELARGTACRTQIKQLKSEKLSPCSSGNLKDHANSYASTTLSWPLSTSKVLFLETPKRSTTFCKIGNEARAPFHSDFGWSKTPLICLEFSHARNWLTNKDLTDIWSAG